MLENGGLHVIMSYMPPNLRIELQGFGRSGRKGEKGSGRMIVYSADTPYHLDDGHENSNSQTMMDAIEYLREERDLREEQRLQEIRIKMIPRVKLERELFELFDKLQTKIKSYFLDDMKVKDAYWSLQMKSLHNKWAFWLDSMSFKVNNVYKSEANRAEIIAEFGRFENKMLEEMKRQANDGIEGLIDEHGELIKLAKYNQEKGRFRKAKANCDAILRLYGEKLGAFAYYYGTLAKYGAKKGGTKIETWQEKMKAAVMLKKSIDLFERDMERIQMRSYVMACVRNNKLESGIGSNVDYFTRSNVNELSAIQVKESLKFFQLKNLNNFL